MSTYYSEENHGPHEIFELGDFELESGTTLPNARIAYKTHGTLNSAKDNAILFPHMWSGTPKAMEIFIGEDRPLDPSRYFIILPGQFANGFSSSPSNTPPPFNGGDFPNVTIGDDVRAQHRLLTERYGIERLELVPEFYKAEAWRGLGFESLDGFVQGFWGAYFAPMDPNNLIWMGWKWRHGDVSLHTGGDLAAALGRITAKTMVVAFSRDMFFPPEDLEAEQRLIPGSTYRVVDSLIAHFAMFCLTPSDREQIDGCIRDLLKEDS
jgi:homoserine acetyltransferase